MPRAMLMIVIAAALAGCTAASASPSPPSRSSPSPAPRETERTTGEASPSPSAARGSAAPRATWEPLPDAPVARLEMATAAHQGQIWLAGGLSSAGAALTEVEVYDPASGTWESGPGLNAPLHHAALVSDGERLLLIGGYLGSSFSTPSELTWILEPGADAWTAGPPLPDARGAGAAAWDGRRIVYGGGVGVGGIAAAVYALEGEAWAPLGRLQGPREHLAATSDGEGRTWMLGGRLGTLQSNLPDVELIQGSGVRKLDSLPTPRGGVAAFFAPGIGACLTGGEAPDRAYPTVECVDAEGAITVLPDLNQPRHGHGAAVIGETAYALLGGPQPTLSVSATVEALGLDRLAP